MWANLHLDFDRKTPSLWKRVLVYSMVLVLTTSCANVLSEMAQKETEAAKLHQAKKLIASGQWASAITVINTLSTENQARRDVKVLLASAYAGSCGLDILALIQNLQNGSGGRLFKMLFTALKNATSTSVSYCYLAESTIKSISTVSTDRTPSENLLMAFLSFAKIGAIIAAKGDLDKDGTLDAAYDPCTDVADLPSSGDTNHIDVNNVVTAVALLMTSLAGLSGGWSSSTSSLTAVCTQIQTYASENVCAMTENATIEASSNKTLIRRAFRALLVEGQSVGLGIGATCTAAFDAACIASCNNT